jgi:hypothetical protein
VLNEKSGFLNPTAKPDAPWQRTPSQ